MNSKELARITGRQHRSLLRVIDNIVLGSPHPVFSESTYISPQNKEIRCFDFDATGVQIIATYSPCIMKGESGIAIAEYLSKNGVPTYTAVARPARGEDKFYYLLKSFLRPFSFNVVREMKVGPYRVDFFIPEMNMIIEFDEKYHDKASQKRNDAKRTIELSRLLTSEEDTIGPRIIRVGVGHEGLGIARIASAMCLDFTENLASLETNRQITNAAEL